MNSSNPFGETPEAPQVPHPPASSNTGLVIGLVLGGLFFGMVVCMGILAALLVPAVQAAREAARRVQCSNNLKQIAIAMHLYHDVYQSFPPAYTVDENGNRLHSWRTLILPFLEQQALYDQIDLSKPWDDPANAVVGETRIDVYACPSVPLQNETTYQVVVDPASMFPGATSVSMDDVVDGTSNTLLVVEVPPPSAVPWMSPQDLDMAAYMNAVGTSPHPGGTNIALADGAVQFAEPWTDSQKKRALVTINDALVAP